MISYIKEGRKWKEVSREERGATCCDLDHWKGWADIDESWGAYTRCETIALNDSTMYRYTTIDPDKKTKQVYQFYGVVRVN